MATSFMTRTYTTLVKILKHPSLYYLICFIIIGNLEMLYHASPPPGDPHLLTLVSTSQWAYIFSFPVVCLLYLNLKSIVKNIFALILIAAMFFLSMYLRVMIDYAMGSQYFGNLISSIFSALSYTIFDILFFLLCTKLTHTDINTQTIAIAAFNIFLIYFVVTNFELVNFLLKSFIHPILFFLFWDYILRRNKILQNS